MAPTIQGTSTSVPNPDHELWFQTDQVIQSWLLGSVTDQLQSVVVHCTTSHEIWTTLDNHFNRPSNSRPFELQHKLQTVTKTTKTMDAYLQEITTISDQLTSIGAPMTDVMKIFTALRGLRKDYEPIKTAIERTIDTQPSTTFDSIVPRFVAFDDRLKSYDTGQEVTPHLAFTSVRSGQGGQYYSSRGRGNRGRSGGRGRGYYTTKGRGFMQQFSSSESDTRVVCQICGKPGHPAFRCYFRFNNNYQPEEPSQALAAMRITDITDEASSDWYADSAATAHVTNSVHNLQQTQPYHGSDTMMVGDGSYLPITHTGSANLASTSGQNHKEGTYQGKKG
ncbi:hypothetical protein Bca101_066716 [Brassica carinata]